MLAFKAKQLEFIYLLGAGIVLFCCALFACTGNYLVLAAPFIALLIYLFIVNWKNAYWLLIFSIPLSIQIGFFDDSLSTSLPDEPLMGLFLGLTIILFCAKKIHFPNWSLRNPLTLLVFLQYIWTIIAVIYSKEPFISIKFLLAKSWFLASFFILPLFIFREKKDFKKPFFLILIPLIVYMTIILVRHKTLGFSFMEINHAIGKLFYNRVDYGAFLSMFFPLLLIAFALSNNINWLWRALLMVVILFFAVCIYLTFARGAMLAVFFCMFIGIAIRLKIVNFIFPAFYGLITLLMVYMVKNNKFMDYRPDYEHTYTHLTFADHMIATFRGKDMSSMERLYRWVAAVRMSKDRPLTGYGPNAFYYYYKPYAVSSFKTYVSRNTEHSTTHNYFIFMLVEQGWPAMLLYALLIFMYFKEAQKVYHRFQDRFYKNLTLGIAMVFAACFINNFFSELLETHKVGSLFYMCIAFLIIMDFKSKKEENSNRDCPLNCVNRN